MRHYFAGLAGLLLSGCAANPSVRYALVPDGSAADIPHMIDAFYFQKNSIRIEIKNTAAAGKPEALDMVVTNRKIEDRSHRIVALRDDSPWKRTIVNFAKVENSDLIQTAGIEVQDRRVEFLQNVAGVIKTIIPLVAGVAGGNQLGPRCQGFPAQPCELDLIVDLAMTATAGESPPGQNLVVRWTDRPSSAIPADSFYRSVVAIPVSGLYYAACRGVEIRFKTPSANYTWSGKIADPRWLEYVAFPRKGNIRMHEQCGVSVTSEKDPTQPLDAVVSAAVTQAVAIKDALDKAGKGDDK